MYGHTITIFNKENVKGVITWHPKVLEGVHYQDKQGVKTGETALFTNNQGYVQIPYTLEGYVSPEEWKNLADKSTKWTLQETDKIAKGSQTDSNVGRTIESIECIDYALMLVNHYGVTLK